MSAALEWAERYVVFEKSSPISGRFQIEKYPFLRAPLAALDNIKKKQVVVYKASSCLGTVFLQIASGFRLDRRPGDMLLVAQSDDDSADWSKTRIRPFIERLEPLVAMLKRDKYAITNDLFQWPHQFALITGPGINSQNSKQVRYLHTDEAHLYAQGVLAAFEKRMGGRWDRASLHVSTAANEGADIDGLYDAGKQNEWHHRCPACKELVWALWREQAQRHYGGKEVFRWRECENEADSLDTITLICPHCRGSFSDNPRERFALCENGDYVPMNMQCPDSKDSYRWAVFAGHWIAWRELLAEHFEALKAARIGDLSKHEDWVKKRECRAYVPEIPDLGESSPMQDYRIGEEWAVPDLLRVGSVDVQDAGGLHFWGQCDEFARDGSSRRVDYRKLSTWAQVRQFQLTHGIKDENMFVDCGFRDREVFARCAEWKWFALKSADDEDFPHYLKSRDGSKTTCVTRPYSTTELQDSMSGKKVERIVYTGHVPPGFCISRTWSKPKLSSILYNLKLGASQRYYGIAKDISGDYTAQLHSYVPTIIKNKTTGASKLVWRQVKKEDHSFATSSMCIIGAMIGGYFPLDFAVVEKDETAEVAA